MKKILSVIISLSLMTGISAQNKTLLLYGNIKNSIGDTVKLWNHYNNYYAVTDSKGNFEFLEQPANPDFMSFQFGDIRTTMFVLGGDTLEMTFDKNDFHNTIHFKGERDKLNQKLAKYSYGSPAPNFSLKSVDGEMVQLSDFKGKYVYIDVWNCQCGPCIREMPVMEKLYEKYKDRNIVFVGVSFDTDEGKWKKMIEKKNLQGVQLLAGGWKSDFAKNYFVYFNPRFIIIDPQQKIHYLSAPRPSGNIEEVFGLLDGL